MGSGFQNLKKRSDFLSIRKNNKSIYSKFLIINLKENRCINDFRLGLTVSKKQGNAVKRNHIKRLLRAVFIKNSSMVPKKFDYEVIPKKEFNESNFKSLEEDLLKILKKIE
ncbi:ribonuclease P protein component [Rickettsiales bacterium]|nr:ribonuclease P protein component [Rickettsiales bacterium]